MGSVVKDGCAPPPPLSSLSFLIKIFFVLVCALCIQSTGAGIDDHQLYVRVILAALPQAKLDLLEVLTAFLGRALDHGYSNGLNLDAAAAIFGPLLSSTAPPYAIKSLVDDLVRHHEAVFTNKPCPFVACARVVESHEATSEWQVSLYRHRHVMVWPPPLIVFAGLPA